MRMRNAREIYEEFVKRASGPFKAAQSSKTPLRDMLKLPAPPFDKAPPVLRTLVTVAGPFSAAAVAGMGMVALALMVLCALLFLLILEHVLGIELSLDPGEMFF